MNKELDHLKYAFINSAVKMQINIFKIENKSTFQKVRKVSMSMSGSSKLKVEENQSDILFTETSDYLIEDKENKQ